MTDMRETLKKILFRVQGGCGIDDARDILAALSEAGLAIVPREATPEMIKAGLVGDPLGCDIEPGQEATIYGRIWEFMVGAA